MGFELAHTGRKGGSIGGGHECSEGLESGTCHVDVKRGSISKEYVVTGNLRLVSHIFCPFGIVLSEGSKCAPDRRLSGVLIHRWHKGTVNLKME